MRELPEEHNRERHPSCSIPITRTAAPQPINSGAAPSTAPTKKNFRGVIRLWGIVQEQVAEKVRVAIARDAKAFVENGGAARRQKRTTNSRNTKHANEPIRPEGEHGRRAVKAAFTHHAATRSVIRCLPLR